MRVYAEVCLRLTCELIYKTTINLARSVSSSVMESIFEKILWNLSENVLGAALGNEHGEYIWATEVLTGKYTTRRMGARLEL